jgi:hypothetical protein
LSVGSARASWRPSPRGTFTYNGRDQLISLRDAVNGLAAFASNAASDLTSQNNPRGVRTDFYYQPGRGWLDLAAACHKPSPASWGSGHLNWRAPKAGKRAKVTEDFWPDER